MANEPYILKSPQVGLAAAILLLGAMIAAPGLGAYSASESDENTIRTKFEGFCMRRGATFGEISAQGDTLTSTFSLADVRQCLDEQVAHSLNMQSNAVDMMRIGGLIMLLGGTLLIPSRKDNENDPKPPRR